MKPQTPMKIPMQKSEGRSQTAYKFMMEKQELLKQAQDNLRKASKRTKKYVDLKRKPLEFDIGDKVLLKLTP